MQSRLVRTPGMYFAQWRSGLCFLFVALITVILIGAATLADTPVEAPPSLAKSGVQVVRLIVNQLGSRSRDLNKDLEVLRANALIAAPLLVSQLHTIPRKTYYEHSKTDCSRHVVACLRALRYLTGISFTASTKSKLSDDERQFLDFDKEMHDANPSHRLHFFGVWMSRNADFVAPLDVQRGIIRQWKQWSSQHASNFHYAPSAPPGDSMDSWFWYG